MVGKKGVGQRIQQVVNDLNMNVTSFSKYIGLKNNVTLGKIVKGTNYPSFDVIRAVLEALPKLNGRWLILGQGSKYIDTSERYELECLKQDVMDLQEGFELLQNSVGELEKAKQG